MSISNQFWIAFLEWSKIEQQHHDIYNFGEIKVQLVHDFEYSMEVESVFAKFKVVFWIACLQQFFNKNNTWYFRGWVFGRHGICLLDNHS